MLISRRILHSDAASSTQSLPGSRHRSDGWRGAHPWGADSLGSIITRALLATKGSPQRLSSLWSRDGEGGTTEQPLSSWGSTKLATENGKWIHRTVELSRDSDRWAASSVRQMGLLKWEPRKKVTGKWRTCYKTHLQKAIIITIVSPKHYLQTSFCTIPPLPTALI